VDWQRHNTFDVLMHLVSSLLLYYVVMIVNVPHPVFPPEAGCDRLVSEHMVIEN
jgi:hypothetical protein